MVSGAGQARVLAIGAHPDDVEIGCGGTLLRHRDAGGAIMLLTLSQGSNGGDPKVRASEAAEAAGLLGAQLRLHDLPDGGILPGNGTVALIEAAIGEFAPTHVYTHCERDTHQDHRAVHAASLVAARSVPHLLCYQSPSSLPTFEPNIYRDISSTIAEKLALLGCHRSQTERRANLEPDLIRATARYWGRFAGYGLVEPFRLVRAKF